MELGQGRRNQGCRRWDFGRYIEPVPKEGTLRPLIIAPHPLPNFQTFLRPCLDIVPPITDQCQYSSTCLSALEESQGHLKVSRSQNKLMVSSILPKKRTKLTILSTVLRIVSFVCFLGRIEDTIIDNFLSRLSDL